MRSITQAENGSNRKEKVSALQLELKSLRETCPDGSIWTAKKIEKKIE